MQPPLARPGEVVDPHITETGSDDEGQAGDVDRVGDGVRGRIDAGDRPVALVRDPLEAVGPLPFVGGEISHLAAQATAAGASARASGASTAATIDQLAVILGIAIALIPTVPLLALYVPLALSWRRDRNAVRSAVARWDGEPELEAFLARRALAHMRFDELRELGGGGAPPDAELAAAELRRLDLDRSARRVVALRRRREPVAR